MNFLDIAGLGKDGRLRTLLRLEEMLMNSTDSKKRRQGNTVRSNELVTENHAFNSLLSETALDRIGSFVANTLKGLQHAIRTRSLGESGIDDVSGETSISIGVLELLILQGSHLLQSKDWMANDEALAVIHTGLLEEVALRADWANEGHDNFLTDGIDGRVGHLGEELLEVVLNLPGLIGQHGQSSVVTHTSECLLTNDGHGQKKHFELFAGVAKHVELAVGLSEIHLGGLHSGGSSPLFKVNHGLVHPLAVRVLSSDTFLDLVIGDDALGLKVNKEHLSGLKAVLDLDIFILQLGEYTNLGGKDDNIVLGYVVTRGTEAIAIQRSADVTTVSEGNHGRSIPRLHEARVVLVECLLGIR